MFAGVLRNSFMNSKFAPSSARILTSLAQTSVTIPSKRGFKTLLDGVRISNENQLWHWQFDTRIFETSKHYLNLNPNDDKDHKRLAALTANYKTRVLHELTYHTYNHQLDHIFLETNMYPEHFCTSYNNHTIDHKVITIRWLQGKGLGSGFVWKNPLRLYPASFIRINPFF